MKNLAEPYTKYYKIFILLFLLLVLIIILIGDIVSIINNDKVLIILLTIMFLILAIGYYLLNRLFAKYVEELYLIENVLEMKIGNEKIEIDLDKIENIEFIRNIVWNKIGIIKLKFTTRTEFGKWIFFSANWSLKEPAYDYLMEKKNERQTQLFGI